MRSFISGALLFAFITSLAACHENGRLAAPGETRARLSFSATGRVGEQVAVVLAYQRRGTQTAPLVAQTFTVVGTGDQRLTVTVDLTA